MPDLVMSVRDVSQVNGQLRADIFGVVADGRGGAVTIFVPFNDNTTLLNTSLVSATKTAMTAEFGIVFLPADKTILLGGAV